MARRALFLIRPFITKKVYLWVSHRRCMFSLCTFWRCTLSVICSTRWHTLHFPCAFHPLSAESSVIRSAFPQLSLILCRKFLILYTAQPLLLCLLAYLAQLISSFPSLLLVIGDSAVCCTLGAVQSDSKAGSSASTVKSVDSSVLFYVIRTDWLSHGGQMTITVTAKRVV